jgi:DNA-binding CsgD family transcriptional regulator/tetratricopeptide (TPR) repeat protein
VVPATGTVPPLGRDSEFATLTDIVATVAAGRGGIVWIEGEPGIGKSTLVNAVLAEASRLHCQVHRAVGDELGQQLPLRALIDALTPDAASEITTLLQSDTPSNVGTTAGTEPTGDLIPGTDAVPAAIERFLVLVDRLSAVAPLVLAFDDLQWADEASLVTWHRLSLAVDQIPLLLVSASRPVPLRPAVARLRRGVVSRGATVVPVGPLPPESAAALVERLAGGVPGPRLRQAVAHAGGNPLYTGELVDALVRDGRVTVADGEAELVGTVDQVPMGLTTAIRGRLDFLSVEAASALRIAALLGSTFSVYDLATVTGHPTSALLPVLDESIAAGVLAESGDRLAFRHGLIRQALYEATPASARSALHAQIGRALARAGLPVGRVAAHLLSAPEAFDGWTVDWLADHATELANRAPELAAALLYTATQLCGAGDPRLDPLLRGRARALFLLTRLDEAEAVARRALASSTDPARAAEVAWTLGSILVRAGRYADTLPILDDALARPGLPDLWRARLRGWRGKALSAGGQQTADAEAEIRWSLAEGERLGDPVTIGYALHELYMINDYETGIGYVERALDVLGDIPELTDLRITLLTNLAYSLESLGKVEPAEAAMREAMLLAERSGTWRLPLVHVQTARRHIEAGRWDDAWAELDPLTRNFGLFEQLLRTGGMALIAAHRDDRARVDELLADVTDLPGPNGYLRGNATLLYRARAVSAEQRGGPAEAVAVYADTVDPGDGLELYDRHQWLPDLVRLALASGDEDLARAAVAAAEIDARDEPLPRRVAAARRARAVLDGDVPTLFAVAEEYRALSIPLSVAHTCEEAAVLLARSGDAAAARAPLAEAVRTYLELGAAWDIRRLDARLRPYGVRRGPRTARRRATTGWAALTPTEQRVAALVAQGRSNPDIAAEMLLSRRTVQTHVSNILAKLGLGSRIEIAREAAVTGR